MADTSGQIQGAPPKRFEGSDFGDGAPPAAPPKDLNNKLFTVYLRDGSSVHVRCFRMFASFDENLGSVLRALRQDETETGVFYNAQAFVLSNPQDWYPPAPESETPA